MCCNLILLENVFFVHSGEQYLPAKRMFLLGLCLMKKRKGWSALKTSVIDAERSVMTAAVAAAASVPSSFTSTTAWWTTFDRTRSLPGDMPVGRRVFSAQSVIEPAFRVADVVYLSCQDCSLCRFPLDDV